jgi:hypothetical protein
MASNKRSRPKSHYRRYCIGKLFKKATGVDLDEFKKDYNQAKEYRENVHQMRSRRSRGTLSPTSGGVTSKGSQKGSGRAYSQNAGHCLRIKSRDNREASVGRPQAQVEVSREEVPSQPSPQKPQLPAPSQAPEQAGKARLTQILRRSRLRSSSAKPNPPPEEAEAPEEPQMRMVSSGEKSASPEELRREREYSPLSEQKRQFIPRATKINRYK